MRIAVLGAGAMGTVFGARLALAGAEVTLLDVNEAHLAAIAQDGLHVDLDGARHQLRLPVMRPGDFTGPADVILLFTKVFHTAAALDSIARAIGDATVLTLQNGIGNAARIEAHVPRDRVILGLTMTPAEFLGPGRVSSRGKATTTFFSADGVHRPLLDELVALMARGGITAKADPGIEAAIWEKAAFNCAMNAISALTDGSPGGIRAFPDALKLAKDTAAEAIAVTRASGVKASVDHVAALIEHAAAHHVQHELSMLQDRKAGWRSEIDALHGAVVAKGVAVPINQTLATLVRLAETMPQYRTTARAALA